MGQVVILNKMIKKILSEVTLEISISVYYPEVAPESLSKWELSVLSYMFFSIA